MIEHRLRPGWRLVEPAEKEVERTATDYRISLDLKAGEEKQIKVVMERPVGESIRLIDLSRSRITAFIKARELSDEVRAAFTRMRDLKRVVDEARREVAKREKRQQEITRDQKRIRDNLARIPRDSGLYRRYIDKLGLQEDEMEHLLDQLDIARQALKTAESKLADYVGGLKI